jgi:fructokinase
MKPFQIGIDLGGTKTEAVLFDPGQKEIRRHRIPTPKAEQQTYAAILDSVVALIRDTISHIPQQHPFTLGIGIPGIIDHQTGLVQNANTTCLIGHPFLSDIEKQIHHPLTMENDANCFTLAESLSGAAKGSGMVVGIILGTGCGGGICVNGRIHHGRHGIAGEWGHFSVDPAGSPCFCGNRGCVETKISGTGVENSFLARFQQRLNMQAIVTGYRQGEPRCSQVFLQFIEDFGRCLGGLISLLDPDAVVLGGGLSNIDELYTLGLERVQKYAFHPHIQTPVLKNRLGDSAGVFGAAWIGR